MNQKLSYLVIFIVAFIIARLIPCGTSETEQTNAGLLQECEAHFKAERPATGQDENALTCYQKVLNTDPNNADALMGLEKIETRYVTWIEGLLARELPEQAEQYLTKLFLINPQSPELPELETRVMQIKVEPLLLECQVYFEADHLTTGQNGNALSCYKQVLKQDPNNPEGLAGLEKIEARYITWIEDFLAKGLQNKIPHYLEGLREVNPNSPKLVELETQFLQQVFGADVNIDIGYLLLECQTHLDQNRLTIGQNGNALSCYKEVLTIDQNNVHALAGLEKIEARYSSLIEEKLNPLLFEKLEEIEEYFARLHKVNPNSSKLLELEAVFLGSIEQAISHKLENRQLEEAKKYFAKLQQFYPNSAKVAELEARFQLMAIETVD